MKTALSNFNEAELSEILKTFGEPSYRAKQLFKWVHQATPFDKMSNLPKSLTAKLSEDYVVTGVSIFKKLVSRDGTVKYLFALDDGKYGKGIINNSKTKVILNLEDEEAQRVGSILHLSEAELMEITHFERGSALISTNNNNVAVEIKCSELEKELITTDRRELQELLKRNGKTG